MAKWGARKQNESQIDLFDRVENLPVREFEVGDRVKSSISFNGKVGIIMGFQKIVTSEFVLVKFANYPNYSCAKATLSFAEVISHE